MKRIRYGSAPAFIAALALAGCANGSSSERTFDPNTQPAPSASQSPSAEEPSAADEAPVEGAALLRARAPSQYGGGLEPTTFTSVTGTAYSGGAAYVKGRAILDPPSGGYYTLPTIVDLTMKVPTEVGTFSCAQGAAMEVEVAFDSNASSKKKNVTGTYSDECTFTIKSATANRIKGTFSGLGFEDGTFDVTLKNQD
jgi:hypothetical protein